MREIKFRAWDKRTKKMIDVSSFYMRRDGSLMDVSNRETGSVEEPNEIIFMQFTGLKDKNGKENFHKDILDWDRNRFVVEWSDENGMWYGQPLAGNQEGGILAGRAFKEAVNIGNIHENPELSEKQ